MVTAAEELKYLRLVKEGEFAKKDLNGESIDIEISSSHGTHMLLRINSDGRVRTGYGQNKTGYCYQTITFLKNN